jgi:hypothetical protein
MERLIATIDRKKKCGKKKKCKEKRKKKSGKSKTLANPETSTDSIRLLLAFKTFKNGIWHGGSEEKKKKKEKKKNVKSQHKP